MAGGGVDSGADGRVESRPDVVNGVRSNNSGKRTRHGFFIYEWPVKTERFR